MIYLLQSGNYLKVGYTDNLKKRISQYNTHNPNIEIISISEGTIQDEAEWQRKYKPVKAEWTPYNEDLINEFIKQATINKIYLEDFDKFNDYVKKTSNSLGRDWYNSYLKSSDIGKEAVRRTYNSKFNSIQIYKDGNTVIWDPVRNSNELYIYNLIKTLKHKPSPV